MNPNLSAALFLGKAIRREFPHEEYFGAGEDPLGFVCSFSYSEKFDDSLLKLLENAMQIEPIQEMEMLSSNAAELFQALGQEALAKKMKTQEGLIHVGRIGDFADVYAGELGKTEAWALLGFEQSKGRVRVFGRAFASKEEKKTFLKKYRLYPEKSAEHFGKELELFEGEFWHPRGMVLKHLLEEYWRECLTAGGFEEVSIGNASPKEYAKETGRTQFGFWEGSEDHLFGKGEFAEWIEASLQIFDLKSEWQGAHLMVEDALGRQWPTAYYEKGQGALFGNKERFIGLLLERYEGCLPFWLAPEQFRVIVFDGVDPKPITEILNRENSRYQLDSGEAPVAEKLHRALRINVPYVIFFGKREETAKSVAIRAYGSKRDDSMTYETFETLVQERKRQPKSQ